MDDDSSELSDLSSVLSIGSEPEDQPEPPKKGILRFLTKKAEPVKKPPTPTPPPPPPQRKRSPSPPHEYTLEDNPDIAFLVMMRCRFTDCFPKSIPHLGPQDIERDVSELVPGRQTELFLCGLLGLVLNRKQDVKPGHYNRALDEAMSVHRSQWPRSWMDKSPLAGGKTFEQLDAAERVTILKVLALWALTSSEVIRAAINKSYRVNRHDDDLNQPLSVQPCGSDSDKRRYYLIEGDDDTAFRIYRESNPAGLKRTWRSVAGTIPELQELAQKLVDKDGGPKARQLSGKILGAIPRFEASEEKRRRREYRVMRKAMFKRPDPGFSLYEGRTRGKRIKYTYDDDDNFDSDSTGPRRSTRGTGASTPAENGPVVTASGRRIRAPTRMNGAEDTRSNTNSIQSDGEDMDVSMAAADGPEGGANGEQDMDNNSSLDDDGYVEERAPEEDEDDEYADDEDAETTNHVPRSLRQQGKSPEERPGTPPKQVPFGNQPRFVPSAAALAYRESPEKAHPIVSQNSV